MGNWSHIENSGKGFANELSRYIYNLENKAKIYLPDLRYSKNLYIFLDYGSNKNEKLKANPITNWLSKNKNGIF